MSGGPDPRLVNVVGLAISQKLGHCAPEVAEHVAGAVWAWFDEGDELYTCCSGVVGGPHHPDCEVAGLFVGPMPW